MMASAPTVADSGDPGIPILKKTYSPNTVLCHQGEICDEIYLLLRGAIQIVSDDQVLQTVDRVGRDFQWDLGAGHCGKGQPAKVDAGGPWLSCEVLVGGRTS